MKPLLPIILAILAIALAACSKPDGAAAPPPATGRHVHTAPHGGTLVELGEHAYNLELVRDAATGKLTAYVLDGHAENFLRVKAPAFEIVATVGAEKRPLTLRAVANSATGETVGDTASFEVQADWLKSTGSFDAVLTSLDVRGRVFSAVAFNFPKGNDPH